MWIRHNGLGCPVPWDTIVETEDLRGERHVGRADDPMNIDEFGNSWVWEDEQPQCFEITFYRIVQPERAIVAAGDCVGVDT